MRSRFTPRGRKVAASFVLFLGLGALFLDPYLLLISAAVAALLIYDALDSRTAANGAASFSPDSFEFSTVRGERTELVSSLTSRRGVELEPPVHFKLAALDYPKGSSEVRLTFQPESPGIYSLNSIPFSALSRFGLFRSSGTAPLKVRAKAYPRFLLAAVSAVEFLMTEGRGSEGEQPLSLLGPGLEYAESREFTPGESLRRIDWRATARLSELMVKKYFREGGGSFSVQYWNSAPGPRTYDQLATGLVNFLISAARAGAPVSATIHTAEGETRTFQGQNQGAVLSDVLELLLEYQRLSYGDIYSIIDLVPVGLERRERLKGYVSAWVKARAASFGSGRRHEEPGWRRFEVERTFVLFSSLVGAKQAVEEAMGLVERGNDVVVCHPARPWADASSLEEAYLIHSSFEKARLFLLTKGCSLYQLESGPEAAARLEVAKAVRGR